MAIALVDTLPRGTVAIVVRQKSGATKNLIILSATNLNPFTYSAAMNRLLAERNTNGVSPSKDETIRLVDASISLTEEQQAQIRLHLAHLRAARKIVLPGYGSATILELRLEP
ncbi:MAG: hypothetical protein V4550_10185 [Gemmatimonadota bacterium]